MWGLSNPHLRRAYLEVPKRDEAKAKRSGATFDAHTRKWYIDTDGALEPFIPWLKRFPLECPAAYAHGGKVKELARLGAKFDWQKNFWYVPLDGDLKKLEKFAKWWPSFIHPPCAWFVCSGCNGRHPSRDLCLTYTCRMCLPKCCKCEPEVDEEKCQECGEMFPTDDVCVECNYCKDHCCRCERDSEDEIDSEFVCEGCGEMFPTGGFCIECTFCKDSCCRCERDSEDEMVCAGCGDEHPDLGPCYECGLCDGCCECETGRCVRCGMKHMPMCTACGKCPDRCCECRSTNNTGNGVSAQGTKRASDPLGIGRATGYSGHQEKRSRRG